MQQSILDLSATQQEGVWRHHSFPNAPALDIDQLRADSHLVFTVNNYKGALRMIPHLGHIAFERGQAPDTAFIVGDSNPLPARLSRTQLLEILHPIVQPPSTDEAKWLLSITAGIHGPWVVTDEASWQNAMELWVESIKNFKATTLTLNYEPVIGGPGLQDQGDLLKYSRELWKETETCLKSIGLSPQPDPASWPTTTTHKTFLAIKSTLRIRSLLASSSRHDSSNPSARELPRATGNVIDIDNLGVPLPRTDEEDVERGSDARGSNENTPQDTSTPESMSTSRHINEGSQEDTEGEDSEDETESQIAASENRSESAVDGSESQRQADQQVVEQARPQVGDQVVEQAAQQDGNQAGVQANEQVGVQAVDEFGEQAVEQVVEQVAQKDGNQASHQSMDQGVAQELAEGATDATNNDDDQLTIFYDQHDPRTIAILQQLSDGNATIPDLGQGSHKLGAHQLFASVCSPKMFRQLQSILRDHKLAIDPEIYLHTMLDKAPYEQVIDYCCKVIRLNTGVKGRGVLADLRSLILRTHELLLAVALNRFVPADIQRLEPGAYERISQRSGLSVKLIKRSYTNGKRWLALTGGHIGMLVFIPSSMIYLNGQATLQECLNDLDVRTLKAVNEQMPRKLKHLYCTLGNHVLKRVLSNADIELGGNIKELLEAHDDFGNLSAQDYIEAIQPLLGSGCLCSDESNET